MAAICWFYHYTPAEFRALTLRDLRELQRFMAEYARQMKKAK